MGLLRKRKGCGLNKLRHFSTDTINSYRPTSHNTAAKFSAEKYLSCVSCVTWLWQFLQFLLPVHNSKQIVH